MSRSEVASIGPLGPEKVSSAGLTLLFEPVAPKLDIVFVHGFTGHPEKTWSTSGSVPVTAQASSSVEGERPSKFRKVFTSASDSGIAKGTTAKGTVYWPRDLLPKVLPQARVLTYGYDTHIRHVVGRPVSTNTLHAHAGDFLATLESNRRKDPSRPLVFVAHSLGGLIVKEALRQSRGYESQPDLRSVFESTTGLVFFGTPHEGADPLGLVHHVVALLTKGVGFRVNDKIVEALSPSAEYQLQLRDEFARMIDERGWIIHSFQEQYALPGLFGKKVVEDTSSCIRHPAAEVAEHIGSNHRDMCRFSGPDDKEFKKVASALQRIATALSGRNPHGIRVTRQTRGSAPSANSIAGDAALEKHLDELVASLKFSQIHNRYSTVEHAHAKTCQWLLNMTEYIGWDNAEHGSENNFLWIKGKPGTGKSTLMKFALSVAKQSRKDAMIIHFFFNARGAELERSTLGLYRSILLQLFQEAPNLRSVLKETHVRDPGEGLQWNIATLKEIFSAAVKRLSDVGDRLLVCYVDALDECDEDEVRDMISYFLDVVDEAASYGVHLRICLSSRHYPHITIKRGLTFDLESQEDHDDDIANYIFSKLYIGDGDYASEVRQQIQAKSSGIFLWVVLVVKILNKEYDRGNMSALRKRLGEIPSGLYGLFEDILTRDCDNLEQLWVCIQWVAFSKRPLTREELYFAIVAGTDESSLEAWDRKEISVPDMGRYILSCSKGLTEVIKKTHTIQFIHESVRDFLLKENGLGKLWPQFKDNFAGNSENKLKECCEAQLRAVPGIDDAQPVLRDGSSRLVKAYPFLKYAVHNVFHHADHAEELGVSQTNFLSLFDRHRWIILSNTLEQYPVRHHTLDANLLYLLAEEDAPHLLKIHPDFASHCDISSDERYQFPLYAALACGRSGAARVLLSQMLPEHCECGIVTPSIDTYMPQYKRADFHHESNDTRNEHALQCIGFCTDLVFLHALVRHGNSCDRIRPKILQIAWKNAPRARDPRVFLILLLHRWTTQDQRVLNNYILDYAAWRSVVDIFKVSLFPNTYTATRTSEPGSLSGILRRYLKPSAGWDWEVPLTTAAAAGNITMAEMLLQFGSVDPNGNPEKAHGRRPLCEAVKQGQVGMVEMLLNCHGIDPDATDSEGRTALQLAILFGYRSPDVLKIVKVLLNSGCTPDKTTTANELTPLYRAVYWGVPDIVRLLLDSGRVDPLRASSTLGETPWSLALKFGGPNIVAAFLDSGLSDADGTLGKQWGSPLHAVLRYSSPSSKFDTIKLLVNSNKVDPNQVFNSKTPLQYAISLVQWDSVRLLLESGRVHPFSEVGSGIAPLCDLTEGGKLDLVRLALETYPNHPQLKNCALKAAWLARKMSRKIRFEGHAGTASIYDTIRKILESHVAAVGD